MTDNDIARKIGALLAKAERTDNPHEAEAFTRKAEALMVKAGIDEAVARAAAGGDVRPEQIVERRIDLWVNPYAAVTTWWPGSPDATRACVRCERDLPARKYPTTKNRGERGVECRECRDGRYQASEAAIRESNAYNAEHVSGWHDIARALGASLYYSGEYAVAYIVGFESDVARVELLARSLKAQVVMAMWSWWASEDRGYVHPSEATKARREFVMSFYWTVARRLREQTRAVADQTPGAALALRDKAAEVRDHMEAKNLRKSGGRNYNGSAAGMAAGRNANLGGRSVSGGHRALSQS